jgi:hypothetical protein
LRKESPVKGLFFPSHRRPNKGLQVDKYIQDETAEVIDLDDYEYIQDVFTEAMYPEEEKEQWLLKDLLFKNSMESISEGFDKLRENGESIEAPYVKLRLLDDLLWNTLVSLGHS